MTPTIQSNFEAYLAWAGIKGVVYANLPPEELEQHPDRVYVWDAQGELLAYAYGETTAFHEDRGLLARRIEEVLHGRSISHSLREPDSPGLQICIHRGWDAATGKDYALLECDFDLHQPVCPGEFIQHQAEVLHNAIDHCKTDQADIAAGLIRRGIIKVVPSDPSERVGPPAEA